jgi:hypothetical protein
VDTLEVAILAASHSFAVQNWGSGNPLGTLNVTGAIAQRFRGAVGTGTGTTVSTGYEKNYQYDERFGYLQPPHFLLPLASPWYVESVSDR